MAELKQVKIHWEMLERYSVFQVMRFEFKYEDKGIGYFRIWNSPETCNIAFYSENEKHGVLPPEEYKAVPNNHKMIRYIEEDMNKMGYTIGENYRKITDGMLIGVQRFPTDWDILY
ncbi:MAG: hypothetical protein LUE14_02180 [Clostridiales bacterium]|nr:hypothetical protein [Clostridiales bacterium]MCD8108899.1 hypothetical protein [Clostridiales bacterium]MCD8133321.1 hypothetical protein [Clostridiales bacterium]